MATTQEIVVTAAQQAEMIELLQDARQLLNHYYWGKGCARNARDIMDKIEKVMLETGVFTYTDEQKRIATNNRLAHAQMKADFEARHRPEELCQLWPKGRRTPQLGVPR
jgi:hypothetical protein